MRISDWTSDVCSSDLADRAGGFERAADNRRALCLGSAIFGDDRDAASRRGHRERLQPAEDILRQSRRAVTQEPEFGKEMVAQSGVGLHRAYQLRKEDWHRIIFGEADLAQVADRRGELSRQRPAVVDIEAG